jgi:hypothetical protein
LRCFCCEERIAIWTFGVTFGQLKYVRIFGLRSLEVKKFLLYPDKCLNFEHQKPRFYPNLAHNLILAFSEYGEQIESDDPLDCKIWRNSTALFRGAEYQRFTRMTSKEALTFYDLNISAQDHQQIFCCEQDNGREDYESEFFGLIGVCIVVNSCFSGPKS